MRRITRNMTRKKRLILIVAFLLVCVMLLFKYSSSQNDMFKITNYSILTEKPIKDLRILLISDLHLKEYGENNEILLNTMKDLDPDMIAVVGDIVIHRKRDFSKAILFLNKASEIAPTFFSAGNHEWTAIHHYKNYSLLHELQASPAKFLQNQLVEFRTGDNEIVVCGFYDEPDALYGYGERILPEFNAEKYEEKFKLLLSHCPMTINNTKTTPLADLVLSGHEHGGQIILPFVNRGVYSRNQGLFPKYFSGLNNIANNNVIISTGLSNSYHLIPRINNQPELVVIDVN